MTDDKRRSSVAQKKDRALRRRNARSIKPAGHSEGVADRMEQLLCQQSAVSQTGNFPSGHVIPC